MTVPFDFLQIHRELCGDASQRTLEDRHVFLLLDRGLGPAASRALRDRRCLGSGASGTWPNPGVYSIPEAAERVVIALERRHQTSIRPREDFSRLAQIVALLQAPFPRAHPLTVREAHFLIEESRTLRKIGLPREAWAEIVRALEENAEPELKIWSERILAHAFLEAEAERRGVVLSEWDLVMRAAQALEGLEPGALPWGAIWERPPGTREIEMVVPALHEAFPAEARFLRALERHLPVHIVRPSAAESSDGNESPEFPLLDLANTEDTARLAIHWAIPQDLPSVVEAAELLPGDFPIDHVESVAPRRRERDRSLFLYAEYLDEEKAPNHLFLRGSGPRARVKECGLDPDANLSAAQILRGLAGERPALARELASVPNATELDALIDERGERADWIKTFVDWNCLDTEAEATEPAREAEHPRLSPLGASLFHLNDLGLTGHAQICLWADRASLLESLDPLSAETLKRRLFPSQLHSLVEAQAGGPLPDPSREARHLADALRALRGRVHLLRETRTTRRRTAPAPVFRAPAPERALSPSGLEAYLRCPLRFYLERVLRFSPTDEWDSTSEYALQTGQWIHRTLELFFDSPEWTEPEARLHALLNEARAEFFASIVTPSYSRLLEARASSFAATLAEHVREFERPLSRLRRLAPEREAKVGGVFAGAPIQGRVDRVDLLDAGGRLLWDYKSGKVDPKSALKQVAKGRLQWPLYCEVLVAADSAAPVWGGGYLNPLRPKDSSLFLVAEGNPHFSELRGIFEAAGHPVEVIEVAPLRRALEIRTTEAVRGIFAGEFPARPEAKEDCVRCDQRAVCGRPFLHEEGEA